ncbi:hypothetical protein HK099_006886, partial [Clydaea vesicula]
MNSLSKKANLHKKLSSAFFKFVKVDKTSKLEYNTFGRNQFEQRHLKRESYSTPSSFLKISLTSPNEEISNTKICPSNKPDSQVDNKVNKLPIAEFNGERKRNLKEETAKFVDHDTRLNNESTSSVDRYFASNNTPVAQSNSDSSANNPPTSPTDPDFFSSKRRSLSQSLASPNQLWVPAHAHPEINPADFKSWISSRWMDAGVTDTNINLAKRSSLKRSKSFIENALVLDKVDPSSTNEEEISVVMEKLEDEMKNCDVIKNLPDTPNTNNNDAILTVEHNNLNILTRSQSLIEKGVKQNLFPTPLKRSKGIRGHHNNRSKSLDERPKELSQRINASTIYDTPLSTPKIVTVSDQSHEEETTKTYEGKSKLEKKKGWLKKKWKKLANLSSPQVRIDFNDGRTISLEEEYDEDVYPELPSEFTQNGVQRLPMELEKFVYQLSHQKLSVRGRPLAEQVIISNLMLYIISVHADITLNRNPRKKGKHRGKKMITEMKNTDEKALDEENGFKKESDNKNISDSGCKYIETMDLEGNEVPLRKESLNMTEVLPDLDVEKISSKNCTINVELPFNANKEVKKLDLDDEFEKKILSFEERKKISNPILEVDKCNSDANDEVPLALLKSLHV